MNKEIFKSISNIIKEVKAVPKSKKSKQGFYYRSVDDILNMINPLFVKNEIILTPKYQIISNEALQTKEGKRQMRTVVLGTFIFYSIKDGSSIEIQSIGEAFDLSDKSFNKAQSYCLKNALIQGFLIPTEKKQELSPTVKDPIPTVENKDIEKPMRKKKPVKLEQEKLIPNTDLKPITAKQISLINNLAGSQEHKEKILLFYKVKDIKELSEEEAEQIIIALEQFKKKTA